MTTSSGRTRRSPARTLTREQVVAGAVRCIDRDGPQMSMGAVAGEMGVAKPRLYRMFTDKSDLDGAVSDWLVAQIYTAVAPDLSLIMQPPQATIHRFLSAYAEVIAAHPNVFRFLVLTQSSSGADPSARPLDIGRRLSHDLAERSRSVLSSVAIDTDGIDHLLRGIVGFVVAVTDLWLDTDPVPRPEPTKVFVDRTTNAVCQLVDGFLREKGVVTKPDMSVAATLATITATSTTEQ
ncbi:TetR/AcrR family transcriptional regulator [Nocardia mangyaensis]|uniref:TetR/AcrR family transcriptional regulator n=1 Tax=Nocardia mangyaensis TaxID=2213200 RepID=UPI00267536EA|nr:TetR family transcriptional regulator [Nocardia mangyaensis]MDO3649876.1 TetR family transcriptional regulator [Nocardia mangyaensis]